LVKQLAHLGPVNLSANVQIWEGEFGLVPWNQINENIIW
jgi:hypothetical protein